MGRRDGNVVNSKIVSHSVQILANVGFLQFYLYLSGESQEKSMRENTSKFKSAINMNA